jgi:sterol-4alpha-carboxylate 3-dehydrogenase (decarboxylating)
MAVKEHVLIVGGAGFLGKAIADMLLDQNYKVSIFDIASPSIKDPRITTYHIGDITNLSDVESALKTITSVIHTASPIHGKPREIYFKVNVEGTKNIIAACLNLEVKKLIYTSSASVIFNGQDLINVNESTPYCEVHMDAYNETKAIAESLVLKANCKEFLTCAVRPSGIFGPRDSQGSLAIVQSAKEGKWKVMIGENKSLFDLTYIDNVAHAHVLCVEKIKFKSGIDGEAFQITNDQPIFFWDYPKILFHELGYRNTQQIVIPTGVAMFLGGIMDGLEWALSPVYALHPTLTRFRVTIINSNRIFDITKSKTVLGYKPIVSLMDGMARTAAYWKENGYAAP